MHAAMESTVMERAATGASYSASVATMALSFNEWMMLGGFLLGVGTFVVGWVYKERTYRLLLKRDGKEAAKCERCDG